MEESISTLTPAPIAEVGEPTKAGHNNNFNFLRLLFSSLVIISHGPEIADGDRHRELLTLLFGTLSFGEFAVSCFFLLSGYLITASWLKRAELVDYFNKRIRRIYPGYLVAFLVCVYIVGPLGAPSSTTYLHQLNWHYLLGTALQLRPPVGGDVFVGTHYPVLNGAMWSIAFEFRCYVLVALVGLAGIKRQATIWLVLLLVTLALFAMPTQLDRIHFPGMNFLLESPAQMARLLAFFSAGACFYLYREQLVLKGSLAGLAFILLLAGLFIPALANIALATVGAYALFWLAFAHIPALDWFKRKDDISYGLYLYGWPVQKLLFMLFPTASPWALLLPALLLAALAGYLSWNLIEKHFLNRISKIR